jgi:hypothetical protein
MKKAQVLSFVGLALVACGSGLPEGGGGSPLHFAAPPGGGNVTLYVSNQLGQLSRGLAA